MSQSTKIILVVGGALAVSCVLLCIAGVVLLPRLASNAFVQDPAQAKKIGAQIADYTLPPGYQEQLGMDVLTTQMVMLGPANKRDPFIVLMQVKTVNANPEQMQQQMQQAMQGQYQGGAFQRVGEETVTIKGQQTVLTVSESQRSQGALRQATGVFTAKSGLGMVMITGPVDEWDWKMLNRFFESIR